MIGFERGVSTIGSGGSGVVERAHEGQSGFENERAQKQNRFVTVSILRSRKAARAANMRQRALCATAISLRKRVSKLAVSSTVDRYSQCARTSVSDDMLPFAASAGSSWRSVLAFLVVSPCDML